MSSRTPVVRQVSWPLVIPQVISASLLALLTAAIWGNSLGPTSLYIGLGLYLLYSFGSRQLLLRYHRAGMRFVRRQQYPEAIDQFKLSYDYFTRHPWIERFRSVVLMSPSAITYREMALVNIAYCYGQAGDKAQMKAYYERALQEYPDSAMARTALNLIATVEG